MVFHFQHVINANFNILTRGHIYQT
jgi:hypothetical protein